jgi:hypothetical protein
LCGGGDVDGLSLEDAIESITRRSKERFEHAPERPWRGRIDGARAKRLVVGELAVSEWLEV